MNPYTRPLWSAALVLIILCGGNLSTLGSGTAPTIVCPSDFSRDNDSGQCSASIFFEIQLTGGNTPTIVCTIGSTVIATDFSATYNFPIGTNTVTCVASNSTGTDSCSFTVVVKDTEAPTISCPSSFSVSEDYHRAGNASFVYFDNPTVSDNCPGATFSCDPSSGSTFSLGNTTVICTATDNATNSASCSFTVTVDPVAPFNDNQDNCDSISGTSGSTSGDNVHSTSESGEPDNNGHTVWWCWTAPSSGCYQFDTTGSDFSTVLCVFRKIGFTLSEEDCSGSFVSFRAFANETYLIRVDGDGGAEGDIFLNWQQLSGPSNDNFADAATISDASGSTFGDNFCATSESAEPSNNGATVWWKWTAPSSGQWAFSTAGSDFDTVLCIYTGADISSLSGAGCNDDYNSTFQSYLEFSATGGTTYWIRVEGFSEAVGNINLAWSQLTVPPGITCPGNVTVGTDPGLCTAQVLFSTIATGVPDPVVTCRTNGVEISSPNVFPRGVTTVECTAANGESPDATCSFTVTVNDSEPPRSCITPPAGMVGWWPGDGTANDVQGSNHGTLQNGATAAGSGKVASAFDLTAGNQFVSVPDSTLWDFGDGEFTIDLWVNFDAVGSANTFLAHDDGSGNTNKWIFWLFNNNLIFHLNSPGLGPVDIGTIPFTPTVNQWYHLAVTRSNNTYTFYIDGNPSTVTDTNTVPNASAALTFGQAEGGNFFDGRLDEIEIFHRALSTAEIQAIVNAGSFGKCKPIYRNNDAGECSADIAFLMVASDNCDPAPAIDCSPSSGADFPIGTNVVTCTITDADNNTTVNSFLIIVKDTDPPQSCVTPPANMVSWWTGDGTPNDLQGANHGTLQNGATYAAGKVGQAFSFNGANQYVDVPNSASLKISGSITLDAWVQPNDTVAEEGLVTIVTKFGQSIGCNSSGAAYGLYLTKVGGVMQPISYMQRPSGSLPSIMGGSISTGVFSHVAVTYDSASGSAFLYVNGQQVASNNFGAGGLCSLSDQSLRIGQDASVSRPFSGLIDEVEIFNRALTSNEIWAIYNAGSFGKCKPISTTNDLNQCGASVNYNTPGFTDNCNGGSIACFPAPGSFFPKGTNSVTCIVDDGNGNSITNSFTITVRDTQIPSITCSSNITTTNSLNLCSAVVTYLTNANDNCPGVVATCTPASGSSFNVGTNTVKCTATDTSGNTNSCTFLVAVLDVQKPSIGCPANILAASDTGQCSKSNVTFTVSASDNCGAVTPVCSPASGSTFQKGVTTVNCTVSDPSGNTNACSFTVTINDTQLPLSCVTPPPTMVAWWPGDGNSNDIVGGNALSVGSGSSSFSAGKVGQAFRFTGTSFLTAGNPAALAITDTNVTIDGWINPTANPAPGVGAIYFGKSQNLANDYLLMYLFDQLIGIVKTSGGETTVITTNTFVPPVGQWTHIAMSYDGGTIRLYVNGVQTGTAAKTGNISNSGSPFVVGGRAGQFLYNGLVDEVEVFHRTLSGAEIKGIFDAGSFGKCKPISTTNDLNQCGATVNYTAPGFSDNCTNTTINCVPAPGSFFPKGTNTVTCVVDDGNGNSITNSFSLTVRDTQIPSITCSSNITTTNALNLCSAVVTYLTNANDNCPGVVATCTPASGSTFNVGTNTVKCVATDTSGNTNSCTFLVAVLDVQKPGISCPANILAASDTGQCSKSNVTFTASGSDNCGSVTPVCSPASGSTFQKGITTVNCIVADAAGNTNACSFTVTIQDTQPPISCVTPPTNMIGWWPGDGNPNDIVGTNHATLTNGATFASGLVGQAYSLNGTNNFVTVPASASLDQSVAYSFDVWVFWKGHLNPSGHEGIIVKIKDSLGTDSYSVFIATADNSLYNVLNDNTWVSGSGTVPLNQWFHLAQTYDGTTARAYINGNQVATFTGSRTISSGPLYFGNRAGNGHFFNGLLDEIEIFNRALSVAEIQSIYKAGSFGKCKSIATTNDLGLCGATVNYATPASSDNCTNTTVNCVPASGSFFAKGTNTVSCIVEDGANNKLTNAFAIVVRDTEAPVINCGTNFSVECGDFWTFTTPTALDNCDGTNVIVVFVNSTTNKNCGGTYSQTINWKATDSSGNSSTCSQIVTVVDTRPPDFICPMSGTVQCGDAWTFGQPSVTDECSITNVTLRIVSTTTNTLCAGTFEAKRTWEAVDECNNTNRCTQTITVVDTTPPALIGCPTNVTVACNEVPQAANVTAVDVCDPNPTVSYNFSRINGSSYQNYTLIRTWTAYDGCGNTNTCSQVITVVDSTTPAITCSSNIVLATDSGTCARSNVTFTVTAYDPCENEIVITCSPTNGSTFPKGTNTVNCTASDSATNTSSCSFTVTIRDQEAPMIFCNTNIVLQADANTCARSNVAFTVTGTDNCDAGFPIVCSPPANSTFAVGTNVVTCTGADSSGNTNTCTFTVTIYETEPPVIVCSPNISVNAPAHAVSNVVTYSTSASDNCAVISTNCTPASGAQFPLGFTTVTCIAKDVSSLTATCSFNVTICSPYVTVLNTNDDGFGSLRWAISNVCDFGTIDFTNSLTNKTIVLTNGELLVDKNLTIIGLGADKLAISGNGNSRIFEFGFGKSNSVSGLTLTHGEGSVGSGGAIFHDFGSLVLSGCVISGNSATDGGGIFSVGGWLTLSNCSVLGNHASVDGAGIRTRDTTNFIFASTIAGNYCGYDGGGMYLEFGASTLINSTISGNLATNAGQVGGGIYFELGSGYIYNCTVASNMTADAPGASVVDHITTVLLIQNTIFSKGGSNDNYMGNGNIISLGYNLANDSSFTGIFGATDIVVTNALLGALQNNGGSTFTHALLLGSPAINAGDPAFNPNFFTPPLTNDQRGSGFVRVADNRIDIGAFEVQAFAPVITCPADRVVTNSSGCSAAVTYSLATATGQPTPTIVCSPPSGSTFPAGTNVVTCTASNQVSTDSCTFRVIVRELTKPVAKCKNITVALGSGGSVTITPSQVDNGSTDNCGIVARSVTPNTFTCSNRGTNVVTLIVMDASGNTNFCTAKVIVVDSTPPDIICPADITVPPTNSSGNIIVFTVPYTNDNCGVISMTCSPASGTRFPKGLTKVTCTAKDAAGNTAKCQFKVTVDNPPVARCKNVSVNAGANCLATASINNGSSDPDGDSITLVQTPPGPYPLGQTIVTLTVTDKWGLSSSCSSTVTVVDATAPIINCPTNLFVNAPNPTSSVMVVYTPITATDSCDTNLTVFCLPPSGTSFPVGTNVVICVVTNDSGSVASCTFSINVNFVTPRATKQDILTKLKAWRAKSKDSTEKSKLDDVISDLTDSLKTSFWLNDTHLVPKCGEDVFCAEKEAVEHLLSLQAYNQKNLKKVVTPVAELQSYILRIVQADRTLAEIAIGDAQALPGRQSDINDALEDFAEGDQRVAQGKYPEAVDSYHNAWDNAQEAVK